MRLTREIDKDNRTTEFINRLLQVWEASVRATHHFLTEQDIQNIKQQGEAALYGIDTLVVAFEEDIPIGFMGIQEKKIEALFLSPDQIGKGWGRLLIDLAIQQYGALYIDNDRPLLRTRGALCHVERTDTRGACSSRRHPGR